MLCCVVLCCFTSLPVIAMPLYDLAESNAKACMPAVLAPPPPPPAGTMRTPAGAGACTGTSSGAVTPAPPPAPPAARPPPAAAVALRPRTAMSCTMRPWPNATARCKGERLAAASMFRNATPRVAPLTRKLRVPLSMSRLTVTMSPALNLSE